MNLAHQAQTQEKSGPLLPGGQNNSLPAIFSETVPARSDSNVWHTTFRNNKRLSTFPEMRTPFTWPGCWYPPYSLRIVIVTLQKIAYLIQPTIGCMPRTSRCTSAYSLAILNNTNITEWQKSALSTQHTRNHVPHLVIYRQAQRYK
jgi:hypothetical protein